MPEKKDFNHVQLLNAAVRDLGIFDHVAPCSCWLRRAGAVVGEEHEETARMERAMVGRHESELWCWAAVPLRLPENQPSNRVFVINLSSFFTHIHSECAIYPPNSPNGSLLNGKCVLSWLHGCRNTKSKVWLLLVWVFSLESAPIMLG